MATQRWPARTLLGSLDAVPVGDLLRLGTARTFARGDHLIREGENTTEAILIVEGLVRIMVRLRTGGDALHAIRIGGDVVGEMAGADNMPRSATVTAAVEVRGRVINQSAFNAFLASHPDVAHGVRRAVVTKLRWSIRRRVDFNRCPVSTRVARVLADLARDYGEQTPDGVAVRRLTQTDLADLVAASARPVERALSDLKAATIITTGYRWFLVHDLDRLTERAELDG